MPPENNISDSRKKYGSCHILHKLEYSYAGRHEHDAQDLAAGYFSAFSMKHSKVIRQQASGHHTGENEDNGHCRTHGLSRDDVSDNIKITE